MLVSTVLALSSAAGQESAEPPERLFSGVVRNALEGTCLECHGSARTKAGLDLSTREGLLRGGDNGPAVVPGNARASLLYRLVSHEQEPFMPHKADKLSAEVLRAISRWIEGGAPYDKPLARRAAQIHWAFRPLGRPQPPAVRQTSWIRNPIDRFVLASLESRSLAPAAEADRRTLIRRLEFDLVGLPPSPPEVERLVDDPSDEAVERLADRRMEDPRFGEKWARHWLDVARYADSSGYESDYDRNFAYPYRDHVIRAMNQDLPYDTFVRWQVAGDEIDPENPEAQAATGFLTCGPLVKTLPTDTRRNKEKYRMDELDDIVSTTASAFLGLTLGCARCHDHKYDPIPQRDYYRMIALFAGAQRRERFLSPPRRRLEEWLESERETWREEKIATLGLAEEERELLRLPLDSNIVSSARLHKRHDAAIRFTDDDLRAHLPEAKRALWAEMESAAAGTPSGKALTILDTMSQDSARSEHNRGTLSQDWARSAHNRGTQSQDWARSEHNRRGQVEKTWLLGRGDPDDKKEEVEPGFLSVLSGNSPRPIRAPAGPPGTGRRTALADWLVDVDRGAGALLARVIVNRLWQHHFGEGLVRTPNDFGTQGERPTHPDLLEWLAARLVDGGWRLKSIHRLIVTSATYRQSMYADPRTLAADPENRLFGRMRPRRLEAEILRDAILQVSGRLDPAMYGPAVKLPVPPDAILTRTKDEYPKQIADGPRTWRRSVYAFIKRSVPLPLLEVFDAPAASASCGMRERTTVAPQALALLNDPFVRARAKDFAEAARDVAGAYAIALGRAPTESERRVAESFLRRRTFADFCQVILLLNEFAYVD